MKPPLHIMICGETGVGKSTLIEKLLLENKRPVSGFITTKLPSDENGVSRIYIHAANKQELQYKAQNLVGTCSVSCSRPYPKAFDTVGVRLLEAPPEGVLLMDELGFLEEEAFYFRNRVMHLLGENIPVLAAVKSIDTPFLQSVRAHKNVRLYRITPANRDALYDRVLPGVIEWNR